MMLKISSDPGVALFSHLPSLRTPAPLSAVHRGFLNREKLRWANCGRGLSGVTAVTGVGTADAKLGQGFILSTDSCAAASGFSCRKASKWGGSTPTPWDG